MSDIDARDFGRLEAQVEALQTEVHSLSKDVKALLELANKGKVTEHAKWAKMTANGKWFFEGVE